jgi:hypothetical protein
LSIRVIAILFVLVILLGALLTVVDGIEPVVAQKPEFSDSNFNEFYSNPSSYVGSKVNITGKIFNIPPIGTSDSKVIQIHHSNNPSANVVVFFNNNVGGILNVDDCVRITGTADKPQEFTNPFGAAIISPALNADSVEKVDCALAINPATRTLLVGQTQEQDSIVLTLEKLEFSAKNTRAYLNLLNLASPAIEFSELMNLPTDVSLDGFGARAIQAGTQFVMIQSFDVAYPQINENIPPGVEEHGVVLFEPMNPERGSISIMFPVNRGFENQYEFIFDINPSDSNVTTYVNLDEGAKISCPSSWSKELNGRGFDEDLFYMRGVYCSPSNSKHSGTVLSMEIIDGSKPQVPLSRYECYSLLDFSKPADVKRCFSLLLEERKHNATTSIINSSFTSVSNNIALDMKYSEPSSNNTIFERHTMADSDPSVPYTEYYILRYNATTEDYDEYWPMAKQILDSVQVPEDVDSAVLPVAPTSTQSERSNETSTSAIDSSEPGGASFAEQQDEMMGDSRAMPAPEINVTEVLEGIREMAKPGFGLVLPE